MANEFEENSNEKKDEAQSKSKVTKWLDENFHKILFGLCIAALLAFFLVFLSYFSFFYPNGFVLSTNPDRWGSFGDFVGGLLNPVLSFLALISIVITINLQLQELKNSQNELVLSRKEMERSRKALEEQIAVGRSQQHDAIVFNLISDIFEERRRILSTNDVSPFHDIVKRMRVETDTILKSKDPRDAFSDTFKHIWNNYEESLNDYIRKIDGLYFIVFRQQRDYGIHARYQIELMSSMMSADEHTFFLYYLLSGIDTTEYILPQLASAFYRERKNDTELDKFARLAVQPW